MDLRFEAAAVDPLMAIAPARAPEAPQPDAPSFDDHLAAQAEPERADPQTAKQADSDQPQTDTPTTPTIVVAAPQTPVMTPALTVQLAAAEPTATPQQAAAPAGTPIDISAPTPEIASAPAQTQPQAPEAAAPQHVAPQTQHAAAVTPEAPAGESATATVNADAPSPQQAETVVKPSEDAATATTAQQPQQQQQQAAAAPELAVQLAAIATAPVAMTAPLTKDVNAPAQLKAIEGAKPASDKSALADPLAANAAPQPKAEAPQAPPSPNAQARVDAVAPKASEAAPAQQITQSADTAAPAQIEQRHAAAEPAPAEAARTAPVASQITREIVRRFSGGVTQFELRLDPAELGRVDVRLEVGRDNKVTAVVAAETPQALSELARGARDIAQALQSAGLELSENGLSFDLSQRQSQSQTSEARSGVSGARTEEDVAPAPIVAARPFGLESWRGVRVDLVA